MYSELLLATLATIFLVIAGLGFGQFVIKRERGSLVGLELIALQILSGFGFLGLSLFLIGSWRWNLPIVLLALIPLALFGLLSFVRHGGYRLPDRKVHHYSTAIAVLCLCAVAAVSRPTGNTGNYAIAYHLLGRAEWSMKGKIAPVLSSLARVVVVDLRREELKDAFRGLRRRRQ